MLNLNSGKEEKNIYKCRFCLQCPVKSECAKKSRYRLLIRGKHEALIEKNRANLISDKGIKEYKKRRNTVEPVFGNIKSNLGFRQFLVRGAEKVKGEFALMCIAHNIKKIASYCEKNIINLDACLI